MPIFERAEITPSFERQNVGGSTTNLPVLRSSPLRPLECFANPQSEGVIVPALCDIGTKIDMIFLVQLEPQPAADIGKEVATLYTLKQLTPSWDYSAKAAESDQTEPLWQFKPILQLCCQTVASEILTSRISSQLIVGGIDAVSVEGGSRQWHRKRRCRPRPVLGSHSNIWRTSLCTTGRNTCYLVLGRKSLK